MCKVYEKVDPLLQNENSISIPKLIMRVGFHFSTCFN